MNYPDREGWWHWKEIENGYDHFDDVLEVYIGPNGSLCVWCEDIGMPIFEQVFSEGDEMLGHIMVSILEGKWTFIEKFK